jgi:hypothetical protein
VKLLENAWNFSRNIRLHKASFPVFPKIYTFSRVVKKRECRVSMIDEAVSIRVFLQKRGEAVQGITNFHHKAACGRQRVRNRRLSFHFHSEIEFQLCLGGC